MARFSWSVLALSLAFGLGACGEVAERAGVVTARTVAGTKTGALEGITVETKDDLNHREKRVIVDVDILHEVKIEPTGDFEVTISSDILPRIHALVVGAGPVALDMKVLEIESSSSPGDPHLDSIEVDQLAFVKQEGEWVLVLQMSRIGLQPAEGSTVNAYQFVSYPSSVAQQMSRDQAILYVDTVLDLASMAQRL